MSKQGKTSTAAKVQPSSVAAAARQQLAGQPQIGVQLRQQTVFDPQVVEQYNRMVPGAAERILAILEANNLAERDARIKPIELQSRANELLADDNRRRDWMAYSLIVGSLAASVAFAYLGYAWMSGASFVAMVMYIALGFFKWRDKR